MKKVLLDSSILLAACRSKSGGSSNILMSCRKKEIQGYISRYVIYEVKKPSHLLNQKEKYRLNFLLLQCKLEVLLEPSDEEIISASKIIKMKDAPILAAALKNEIDYLITLDRTDFLTTSAKNYVKPMKIVTPKDFIEEIS